MTVTNTERWRRLEVLFDQALELPEAERSDLLAEACAGDLELHSELKKLLANAVTAGASLRNAVVAEVQSLAKGAATAQVGRRIDRFRLIELLGEGGMGAVYLAERNDAQFSHRVAIKILRHAVGSPGAVARFRDERQILAALEHPNGRGASSAGARALESCVRRQAPRSPTSCGEVTLPD